MVLRSESSEVLLWRAERRWCGRVSATLDTRVKAGRGQVLQHHSQIRSNILMLKLTFSPILAHLRPGVSRGDVSSRCACQSSSLLPLSPAAAAQHGCHAIPPPCKSRLLSILQHTTYNAYLTAWTTDSTKDAVHGSCIFTHGASTSPVFRYSSPIIRLLSPSSVLDSTASDVSRSFLHIRRPTEPL